jgi:hypothetical protein
VATLEETAEAALAGMQKLEARLDASEEKLEALRGALAEAARRLERDWTPFAEAAGALVAAVRERARSLPEEGQAAQRELRRILRVDGGEAAGASLGRVAEAALRGAARSMDSFHLWMDDAVPALHQTQLLMSAQGLGAVTGRLEVLEGAMERTLDGLRQALLQSVKPGFHDVAAELAARVGRVRQVLSDELLPAVEDDEAGWHALLAEAEGAMREQAFAAAGAHAGAVLAEGHAARAQAGHDFLDAAAADAGAAAAALQALTASVSAATAAARAEGDEVRAQAASAAGALRAAAGRLEEAGRFLASRGFC